MEKIYPSTSSYSTISSRHKFKPENGVVYRQMLKASNCICALTIQQEGCRKTLHCFKYFQNIAKPFHARNVFVIQSHWKLFYIQTCSLVCCNLLTDLYHRNQNTSATLFDLFMSFVKQKNNGKCRAFYASLVFSPFFSLKTNRLRIANKVKRLLLLEICCTRNKASSLSLPDSNSPPFWRPSQILPFVNNCKGHSSNFIIHIGTIWGWVSPESPCYNWTSNDNSLRRSLHFWWFQVYRAFHKPFYVK